MLSKTPVCLYSSIAPELLVDVIGKIRTTTLFYVAVIIWLKLWFSKCARGPVECMPKASISSSPALHHLYVCWIFSSTVRCWLLVLPRLHPNRTSLQTTSVERDCNWRTCSRVCNAISRSLFAHPLPLLILNRTLGILDENRSIAYQRLELNVALGVRKAISQCRISNTRNVSISAIAVSERFCEKVAHGIEESADQKRHIIVEPTAVSCWECKATSCWYDVFLSDQ